MPKESDNKSIGLNELIFQVKRELLYPPTSSNDPVPMLTVDEIQLELSVVVHKEAQGGINIQVVSAGGIIAKENVQLVRVTLKPLRNREELIADLQKTNPELMENVIIKAQRLVRGQQDDDQPISWP